VSARVIAVLEDGRGRVEHMRAACTGLDLRVFTTAGAFLAWWRRRNEDVALVSLDFHLGPPSAGKGIDVARGLALGQPCCPVILHTSDVFGARAMAQVLSASGWTVTAAPFEGAAWGPLASRLLAG
jgi:hypothetical protein